MRIYFILDLAMIGQSSVLDSFFFSIGIKVHFTLPKALGSKAS